MSFTLRFDLPGNPEDYHYELAFENTQNPALALLHEERLSVGDRLLFHQRGRKWLQRPEIPNLPQPGSLMLGGMTGLPDATWAYLVLCNGLGCYAFPDTVLVRPRLAKRQDQEGLSDSGDNFLPVFRNITSNLQAWSHLREMIAALRSLNGSVKTLEVEMPQRSRILVNHEIGGVPMLLPLQQASEGFRRFLAHLIALYQSPPKQTLIFEQPEKGIHPGALATLAEEFKTCPGQGRGQVILTTHSPELLDHFSPESLRVVDIRNYLTTIAPVAAEQVEALREHLLRPGELLTVDPARPAETTATVG
jgi:AAA domain, putative AbiEii toxin, Type IV TA system